MDLWWKSSHSGPNGCVEVTVVDGQIAVRNSRDRQGPILRFTTDEWQAFLDGVQDGEFDLA